MSGDTVVRLCDWCGRNEVLRHLDGTTFACELEGCIAAFCGTWCTDFHMGKHEDYGDCVRDRNGEVISPRSRGLGGVSSQLVR
jgi:hypothetical protein